MLEQEPFERERRSPAEHVAIRGVPFVHPWVIYSEEPFSFDRKPPVYTLRPRYPHQCRVCLHSKMQFDDVARMFSDTACIFNFKIPIYLLVEDQGLDPLHPDVYLERFLGRLPVKVKHRTTVAGTDQAVTMDHCIPFGNVLLHMAMCGKNASRARDIAPHEWAVWLNSHSQPNRPYSEALLLRMVNVAIGNARYYQLTAASKWVDEKLMLMARIGD